MKTATKVVKLPHLGLNAYEVEGRSYVSLSELNRATRPTSKKVDHIVKWMRGGSNPSDTNGSQGFPQEIGGGSFECNVPRPNGSHVIANLLSPEVAWLWILHEVTNESKDVAQRALTFIQVVGAAGFRTITEEALGLRVSVEDNLSAAIRLVAEQNVAANDFQEIKVALYQVLKPDLGVKTVKDLPKDDRFPAPGVSPISKEIQFVLLAHIQRLDEGVVPGIRVVQKTSPRVNGKKATMYSCLTPEARTALKPVAKATIIALKQLRHLPATADDIRRVVASIDEIYPRY